MTLDDRENVYQSSGFRCTIRPITFYGGLTGHYYSVTFGGQEITMSRQDLIAMTTWLGQVLYNF